MAKIDLKFEGNFKFTDISHQMDRTYHYENSEQSISEPAFLNIGKQGGHNILDEQGMSHYIPKGWLRVSWKTKEGQPNFKR